MKTTNLKNILIKEVSKAELLVYHTLHILKKTVQPAKLTAQRMSSFWANQ
jgi:hypothetical protein